MVPRLEVLESRSLLAGLPIISEFLASNGGGLTDQDGESSDWIEIYNPDSSPINLAGWALTDTAGDLNQWQFPNVTIGANQFLTVFASGKNRTTLPELHTNFRLSAGGEFLGLVDPSGTIISQYAPSFPPQVNNVSYGAVFDTANLIVPGSRADILVPSNGSLGNSWTNTTFNTAGWTSGTTGVGFGVVQPGFNVTYIKANVDVADLDVARQVATTSSMQIQVVRDHAEIVNYMGNGGGGHYDSDLAFPTQSIGDDVDHFVVQAHGSITIPAAGAWTFGVNSDDGFELKLQKNGVTFVSEYIQPRGPSDTVTTFQIPEAGDWDISLLMYERGGGASVELFAAAGSFSQFDQTSFDLVGDTSAGGLAVYSTIGAESNVVVGTNVGSAMLGINSSAYLRIPFMATNPSSYEALLLNMRYDDGFVAYLNGVEVARRNAPATLAFNSSATVDRSLVDATTVETISLTSFIGLLNNGQNVLAIQGLNSSSADPSFLVLPELTGVAIEAGQARYFRSPTPGAPNATPSQGFVERVTASVPAGFFTSSFNVTLSTATPNSAIRYTLDGSTPTETNGLVYSGPIAVSSTTTLRAGAFRTDFISLPSISRTYLFLDDVIRQSPSDDVEGGDPDVGEPPVGWPSSWGNNVVDYGMDQAIVQQEGAARVKNALLAIPSISITTDLANLFDPSTGIYANAYQDGRDWERPASVELLNPDGTSGFQVNAGLRVRGGYSRSGDNPKHAFRLFFRGEYGDSSLDYPLFGTEGTDSFKKIDLRTAQNYSWSFGGDPSNTMIQDVFARESQSAMEQPATRSRWYHLYIDGQYWGVYQTQERAEAEFAASYFGGSPTNYDVMKPEAGSYTVFATDGNPVAYNHLYDLATTLDLSSNANYFRLQGKDANGEDDLSIPNSDVLVDVDNLVTYMIGILHGGNLDAPISAFLGNNAVNNFFAVRDRTAREGFKYFQHDSEHTLHNVNEDRNGPYPAGQQIQHFNPQYLHQLLMSNAEYRKTFADAVQKNFFNGGPMTATNAQARFQSHANILDQAIIAESARWGDAKRQTSPLGRADWLGAVDAMQNGFLGNRNPILIQQFRNNGLFPLIEAPQPLINGTPQLSGQITPGSLLRYSASGGGLVYYTTDGSDPRLVGGGINPTASSYDPSEITTTLLSRGTSWKYFDRGTDLGTTWRGSTFNDTTWASGNAELGYGDGDEVTTVGFGPNASAKYITTYFRKEFNVADASSVSGLRLRLKRDDGAVVYINGVEVARSNMPSGTITAATLASTAVGGNEEQQFFEFDISPASIANGRNVIAIELHQSNATSSDISFDAELVATSSSNPGLRLNGPTHLLARTFNGTEWSPVIESVFSTAVPATSSNLAITELHYNPAVQAGATTAPFNDKDNFEFIELRNIGTDYVSLSGVRFTVGITFDFSSGDVPFLAPQQSVVVVKSRPAFDLRYGTSVLVAGVFGGNLNNGGEQIRLVDGSGATIQDFTFDDDLTTTPAWPEPADGGGYSLTVRNFAGNYNLPSNWRASYLLHGTPGFEENDFPANLQLSSNTVSENLPGAIIGNLSATDPNFGDSVTFSLVPGFDASKFQVLGNTLRVGALGLDYEASATRQAIVRATDRAGLFIDVLFTIQVLNVNEVPVITSGSTIAMAENSTAVTTVTAVDPELTALTYSIAGGVDQAAFTINATSGALAFRLPPNFESPTDANRDNVYLVTVGASDGFNPPVTQTLSITVTDLVETTFTFAAGLLSVFGTDGSNDFLRVFLDAGIVKIDAGGSVANTTLTFAQVRAVTISGMGGDDTLTIDRSLGSLVVGTVLGGSGDDLLISGIGSDTLDGGPGLDTVSYAQASSLVRVNLALATAQNTAGAGSDKLLGIENLIGSDFNDTLTGNTGDNVLSGGLGNDSLSGGLGRDSLLGGDGDDSLIIDNLDTTVIGGVGLDRVTVTGATGPVTLNLVTSQLETVSATTSTFNNTFDATGATWVVSITGGKGSDTIYGGELADTLVGGDGADVIRGNGGNDRITGGLGADSLSGGSGNDSLTIDNLDTSVQGGLDVDTVTVAGATSAVNLNLAAGQIETVSAATSTFDNVFDATGATWVVSITGGSGNDSIYGGVMNDSLSGGAGNDRLFGNGGNDRLTGGLGNDWFEGGEENDLLTIDNLDLHVVGGGGSDQVNVTGALGPVSLNLAIGFIEIVSATTSTYNNIFDASGALWRVTITGGTGNDLILGGNQDDTLNGGAGNDIIVGGSGNDRMDGGTGRDLLVGGFGIDRLTGGTDDDLLIGNRFISENNPSALTQVLSEWTSARSYSERIANLKGLGTGVRNNGTTFIDDSTVVDDGVIDTLMGSLGDDWFVSPSYDDLTPDRLVTELLN